jgi:hypothetical protein
MVVVVVVVFVVGVGSSCHQTAPVVDEALGPSWANVQNLPR